MWKIGDRVLAHRSPGIYRYPGTIRHIDGQRYYVIFDDGEDALVTADELAKCQFDIGDQVFVHSGTKDEYLPARVSAVSGDKLTVRFPKGDQKRVELKAIRVHPETWKSPPEPEIEPVGWPISDWQIGDRVWACWYDMEWYPGIVLDAEEGRVMVLFDTGNQAMLPPQKVRPFVLEPGDEVTCRHRHSPEFTDVTIVEVNGELVKVRHEDGTEETTSVRLLRAHRDEWLPGEAVIPLERGARVLAQWYDMYWYPGIILSVDGKRVHISFDDGDQALVTPDQVDRLHLEPGMRVYCRYLAGPEFLPAEIVEVNGEIISVRYEDGEEEETSVRMIRIER